MAVVIGAEFQMFAFWKEARDPSYPCHFSSAGKRCSSHVTKVEPPVEDKRVCDDDTVDDVFLFKFKISKRGFLLRLKICIVFVCLCIFFFTCFNRLKAAAACAKFSSKAIVMRSVNENKLFKKINRTKNLNYLVLVVKYQVNKYLPQNAATST